MSNLSIGDLANTFQLRRFTSERKADLSRLAKELTTGMKADLGAAVTTRIHPGAGHGILEDDISALRAILNTAG